MPNLALDKLKPGMKLGKPLISPNGMVLLSEGTELTERWIDRIGDMGIKGVFIDGPAEQSMPKDEALAKLEMRFKKVDDMPYMPMLKKIVKEHIEKLYG